MPKINMNNSKILSSRRRWQRVTAYLTLLTCLFTFGVPNLTAPLPVQAATPVVTSIKASESFAIALKSDGTVWGWGNNSFGQLGNGSTINESVPVPVQSLTKVKAIATGPSHALALQEDGTVYAWGHNGYGELLEGTSNIDSIPVQVSGLSNVIAIAAGRSHSLALTNDGTVWAWGNNDHGRLGDGTTTFRYTPVHLSGLTNVVSISAGYENSYAVQADGSLWAWGRNNNAQIGDGTNTDRFTPQRINSVSGVKSVAAATGALALLTDGTVLQWGPVWVSGLGQYVNQKSPTLVKGLSGMIEIATAQNASLAIGNDHTIWMWGSGILPGNGYWDSGEIPVAVQGLNGVTAVGMGLFDMLALQDDGTVWGCGINYYGILGIGTGETQMKPVQNLVHSTPLAPRVTWIPSASYPIPYTEPLSLKVHFSQRMQMATLNTTNVTLRDNDNNPVDFKMKPSDKSLDIYTEAPLQLSKRYTLTLTNLVDAYGISMSLPYTYDFEVELPFPAWKSPVSAGATHSIASYAGVYAWGDNSSGQLGDGTTIRRNMPVPVQGLSGNIEFLVAGGGHSLAIQPDGSVVAWGDNSNGQLGNGSNANKSTPVSVPQMTDAVALAAGANHTLALKKDGTVWAWGANSSGQLGDGSLVDKSSPVRILSRIVYIAAGGDHSLAVTDEGKVLAWGNNQWGQLGNGNDTDELTPMAIPSLAQVQRVAAGWTHSLALKNDGSVWAWGDNTEGQLGIGSHDQYASNPVQVQTLDNIASVQAGYGFSLAVRNNLTLMAWGQNFFNQLGDNSTDKVKTVPVHVSSLNSVSNVAAGGYHGVVTGVPFKAWGLNIFGQLGNGLTEHASSPTDTLMGQLPVSFRLAGQDASDTAAQIAETGWNYGSSTAIVVNERAYSDALTGTVLAGALDAPVLLTNAKNLTPVTANTLSVLNPETVFILGGTAVVSAEIEQQLKEQYQTVTRIGGFDQYETSAKIARYLQEQHLITPGKAVVAFGENFPDALAVSSLAAYQRIPILLTRTHSLPSNTQQALQDLHVTETIVVGGTAVISADVAALLPSVTRYWGMDKYDTAIAIAKEMKADTQTIFLATGENFPDALAGSVLAARTNSPIILVNRNLPMSAESFVRERRSQIKVVMVLGGTAVVSEAVLESIGDNL